MRWTVRQVAEAKGIKNARELGDKIEASYSSIYPIWNGTAKRVDLETLNKLCNLLDVPIGMLLSHIPDGSKEKPQIKNDRQAANIKTAGRPRKRKANS